MHQADYPQFLKTLISMAEIKRASFSPEAMALYFEAVRDWPLEDFKAAAVRLIRTSDWMPQPSDFDKLRRAALIQPGEAFDLALKHAASSNWRKGPTGIASIDNAVDAIGGYQVIAMCDIDKLHFLERRFCEHYQKLQDSRDVREELPYLSVLRTPKTALTDESGRVGVRP